MRTRDWCRWLLRALRLRRRGVDGGPGSAVLPSGAAGEQILQQLTRVRTASGTESIRAKLLAEFATGQRETALYVGFCPPFEQLPEVEVSTEDETVAVLNVVQRLHNGAQLEVRLAEPAEEPFAAVVQLVATSAASTARGGLSGPR